MYTRNPNQLVGKVVCFPRRNQDYSEGVITDYNVTTGTVVVRGYNGELWQGYTYQLSRFDSQSV